MCCRSRDEQVPISRSDQNQTSAGLQVQGERLVLQSADRPIVRVSIISPLNGCKVQTGTERCKCSRLKAFYRQLLRGYGFLFERRARSVYGNVTSEPKWK
jgi:hypothetical protein